MTKEQKILLLFVLAIAASSATFYVVKTKSDASPINNITQVSTNTEVPVAEPALDVTPAPAPAPTPTPIPKPVPIPKPIPVTKTYKETLSYAAPDEYVETIIVTTILDTTGIISDITFAYNTPTNRQSMEYLQSFAKEFKKSLVIGKSITTAHISRVGGASLTTGAFNNALASIAVKAKM